MSVVVNTSLLIRYHQGLCSGEEIEAVVEWLLNPEEEGLLTLPEGEFEPEHQAHIWHVIQEKLPSNDSSFRLVQRINRYFPKALAACVAMITMGWCILTAIGTLHSSRVWTNASISELKTLETDGLTLTLSPQSKAQMQSSFWGKPTEIDFSGAVAITNRSDQEMQVIIHSPNTSEVKEIKISRGRSYVAMQYHFLSNEIIIVEKNRLLDLPAPLIAKVMHDFDAI
ncbi:hypothetical protein [Siphonobacter sp. SORGH_AS_1065]|uniref:hypothetical protein n=1 Tax=Siphonobacter sp. SORGH_AS_1065 TaxID=3041795 RepID=UPI00278785D0|nr:hypothetical protein [Siphonobacter sp. SORGH_AS_1065]MDQ1089190.1 hypothetical protein [Siphonobacter sp. SORGH_AS_1065]